MTRSTLMRSMASIIFILACLYNAAALASEFTITIDRNMTCKDQSTIGRLLVNGQEIGRSLELPWRNNETSISRIPPGTYPAIIRSDGRRKWRLQLENVADRKYIQIHVGNYQRQIEGCILVGSAVSNNKNECMVVNSKATLAKLANEMSRYSAELGKNMSVPINISVVVR